MVPVEQNQVGDHVVIWGTYDLGKPRTRILRQAARRVFGEVTEIHADVWSGIEDKTQIGGWQYKLRVVARLLLAYPRLVYRYLNSRPHDYVLIPYLGLFDLVVVFPFAKLQRVKICLDIFISLYDTVVVDRELICEKNPLAKMLFGIEWCCLRLANVLLIDTEPHARYVEQLFGLKDHRVNKVWVGTEDSFHAEPIVNRSLGSGGEVIEVLFYGQFIPLHGLDVIVDAIHLLELEGRGNLHWTIVGTGQLQSKIDHKITELGLQSVSRIQWISYESLLQEIWHSDLCLGVFSGKGKSQRVIPNKVFQVLASGSPLITGDTPAIRELLDESESVCLTEPGNPRALAEAVVAMADRIRSGALANPKPFVVDAGVIGGQLATALKR